MSRDYKLYLEDIVEAVSRVKHYLTGQTWADASKDPKTRDAVLRNLEIIGEAVKNLPPNLKRSNAGVEWRKIGGLRDLLAHQYFGVDEAIIGNIVEEKLPELEQVVLGILEDEGKKSLGTHESPATYRTRPKRRPVPRTRKRPRKKK